MPEDDNTATEDEAQPNKANASSQRSTQQPKPLFRTPESIKRLFNKFPLQTHAPNELPRRTVVDRSKNNLYVFTTNEAARRGAPSFNPSCLKWQAYLTFLGIRFATVASNNHASPNGALPFLLPASSGPTIESPQPLPSNKLQGWASENSNAPKELPNMRYEVYLSLLDNRIRNAWLFSLYLIPSNFESVAKPRYIDPTSSDLLVRMTLSYQLCQAAAAELLKQSAVIDVESLFREAEKAWDALSELLGSDDYFFAGDTPGLFDASVFAYTHLLLSESIQWADQRLSRGLATYKNLVDHREKISKRYFNETRHT